ASFHRPLPSEFISRGERLRAVAGVQSHPRAGRHRGASAQEGYRQWLPLEAPESLQCQCTASTSTSTGAPTSAVMLRPLTRHRPPVAAPAVITDPPQAPHYPRVRMQQGCRATRPAPRVQSHVVVQHLRVGRDRAQAQLAGATAQLVTAQAQAAALQAEFATMLRARRARRKGRARRWSAFSFLALRSAWCHPRRRLDPRPPTRQLPVRLAPASFPPRLPVYHAAPWDISPVAFLLLHTRYTAWYTQYTPSSGPFPPCPCTRECEIAPCELHTASSDAPRSSSVHALLAAHPRAPSSAVPVPLVSRTSPLVPSPHSRPSPLTPPCGCAHALTHTAHNYPTECTHPEISPAANRISSLIPSYVQLNSPHAQIE
ncbi:hypothetical protein FB451DRAFT_1434709, partial [Mycena latifolia]